MIVKRIFNFALVVTGLFITTNAIAATQAQLDTMRAKSLAYLISQQQGDGSWRDAQGNGIQATAMAIEALYQAGVTTGYVPGVAASWLQNAEAQSVDGLSRQISALVKLGIPVPSQINRLVSMKDNIRDGGWGAYASYESTMPDTAFGFDAVLKEGTFAFSDAGLSVITNMQNTNGGWPYRKDSAGRAKSALVPTAYGVLVLSNYLKARPTAGSVVNTSINNGINWLLANKKNDNGYAEDLDINGVNTPSKPGRIFETSLVKTALSAAKSAGIAAANTSQANQALAQMDDFFIARQATNGSWGGDVFQTAMVGQAQATTVLTDTDRDGIPDSVEAFISGSNVNVADSRNLPKGNGDPGKPPLTPPANDNADVPLPAWAIALMGASMLGIARKKRKASNTNIAAVPVSENSHNNNIE